VQTLEHLIARENKGQSFRATQLLDAGVSKIPTKRFLGEVIGIRNHPGEWYSDPNLVTVRRCRFTVYSRGISSRAAKASAANFRLVVEPPLAPGEVITSLLQILVTNIVRQGYFDPNYRPVREEHRSVRVFHRGITV
jgi:hypothetical protein